MSIDRKVTKQDLSNLSQLAVQQKNQRALKIKTRILKQAHDIKLDENLFNITKNLDEVDEAAKKI